MGVGVNVLGGHYLDANRPFAWLSSGFLPPVPRADGTAAPGSGPGANKRISWAKIQGHFGVAEGR